MKNSATHVSYGVSDISKTVAFYSKLFGTRAIKVKDDYAKFELEEPSLIISFIKSPEAAKIGLPGAHFGIRVSSTEQVIQKRKEMEAHQIGVDVEDNVSCCYAIQDKFWVTDPDGIRWEIYTFKGDAEALQSSDEDSACCVPGNSEERETAACC